MKKNERFEYRIKEDDMFFYLELRGGMDIGYLKPLKKDKEEIIEEFKRRIHFFHGILIED